MPKELKKPKKSKLTITTVENGREITKVIKPKHKIYLIPSRRVLRSPPAGPSSRSTPYMNATQPSSSDTVTDEIQPAIADDQSVDQWYDIDVNSYDKSNNVDRTLLFISLMLIQYQCHYLMHLHIRYLEAS